MAKIVKFANLFKKVDLTKYRVDGWFGAGSNQALQKQPTDNIRPFRVNYTDVELQDLKHRLANARFADHIDGTQFTYGANSKALKHVVEYWREQYDWRKEEAKLNAFEQFKTQIEGIDIHFIRVKPTKPAKTIIPLLVIHGWPNSVLEYYKSFPLLTEPDQNGLAFEVIAPSIPGYGYSEAPYQKRFNVTSAARVFTKLMKRLDHDKFVVHGGDWGNLIARTTSILYPQNVIGVHLLSNWDGLQYTTSMWLLTKVLLAEYFPSLFFSSLSKAREYAKMHPLEDKIYWMMEESAYLHSNATKPDTLGAALVDSPVGLAAHILEKYSTWTNPEYSTREDGGLTERFTLDELLTNIMIYWTSGNVTSGLRFFKENILLKNELLSAKITVPAATADAPNEIIRTPLKLMKQNFTDLVQYTELPRGGHFTAFEEPQLVCDDIRSFVSKVIDRN